MAAYALIARPEPIRSACQVSIINRHMEMQKGECSLQAAEGYYPWQRVPNGRRNVTSKGRNHRRQGGQGRAEQFVSAHKSGSS